MEEGQNNIQDNTQETNKIPFTHLHVHTRYSVLDGACEVSALADKAVSLGMKALAITDHGNMYGVMDFVNKAKKKGLKPIVGCEFYVAEKSRFEKQGREDRSGFHLILLAKNIQGYHNLCKLCTLGFKKEAFYYTPRIDHSLLEEYHEGIIACSACLAGELPQAILNGNESKIHETISFFKGLFGEDYYFEFQDHGHEEQKEVNIKLAELALQYQIKCIATNDVHFINAEDKDAHQILICLNTGKKLSEETKLFYTGKEYLKSYDEMLQCFPNNPEYLSNTQEIVDKVESFELEHEILLPKFPLPEGFTEEMDYLRYVTYQGAKVRYGENYSPDIKERIDFELDTIAKMGFPGYFLIVWDFIKAAREMGVLVGPGRGSAAGSAIAYCTAITNIDPIKYNLLFERFLNPGRISMPDIDVDFDDIGREKVIKYVVEKYGEDKVAQIITYGTMASKSAIKDVARVLELPLSESTRLAGLVPADAKMTLPKAMAEVPELKKELEESPNPLIRKTLKYALQLEGSIRSVGTHACGMIIAPENIMEYVPLSTSKDSDMPVTQYEGTFVEPAGLLKMDFLGLKTLTIIKEALDNIELRHKIRIDIEDIPLDDLETYALFGRGDTSGIFQFESEGMKKYLRDLKPSRLEDLIAMNALYRPGPMEYIPEFIDRKFGRKAIEYDLPVMEEYLSETYGIAVYQEHVMLLSQKLANFTKSDADTLRKAMGKKKMDVLEKMKSKFDEGCKANGHDPVKCNKIWGDWESFASYAFNKSHSTCYAYIAYQTAYLKAHYPAEFMASVLTNNLSNIEKISFYMDECKYAKINLLGPDLNESQSHFTVNTAGSIRFGLSAIKNVGENVVESIVAEREKNGQYQNVIDFVKRANLKTLNKRCMEALAKAGAFDSLGNYARSSFFYKKPGDDRTFIDQLVQYAADYQRNTNSAQASLFGESEEKGEEIGIDIPSTEPWSTIEQAKNEKEVTGFYITGHPLSEYKFEVQNLSNATLSVLKNQQTELNGKTLNLCFMVTQHRNGVTKNGKDYGRITIEDFEDNYELVLFGENYLKYRHLLEVGRFIFAQAILKPRWGNNAELEFTPLKMTLLEEALDTYVKKIELKISLDNVSAEMVEKVVALVSKNTVGKQKRDEAQGSSLVFKVYNHECSLTMPKILGRLKTADFIKELRAQEVEGIEVSVSR